MGTIDPIIPTSRIADPATSRTAAAGARKSADAVAKKLLDACRAHPGKTAVELAKIAGVDRQDGSRRLADLRRLGYVFNGRTIICPISGTKMMTWIATSDGSKIIPAKCVECEASGDPSDELAIFECEVCNGFGALPHPRNYHESVECDSCKGTGGLKLGCTMCGKVLHEFFG